jgi:hypothetical protein
MELLNLFTKGGYKMLNTFQTLIITLPLITFSFAQPECQSYYADIDGDGDGAKSVWCSFTELPHATGGNWEDANWETNGCGTVGWNGDTPAGHLTYGPYISTDPGVTHVTWNMLANGDTNNDGTQIATIDIFDSTSGELLAWQNINVNDFNASMAWQDFSLSYYSSPDHVYEFRTWYTSQGGHLVLRYITHINVEADAQGAYETVELCNGDDTSGWSLNTEDLMPLCAGNSNDACWDECGIWGGSGPEANYDCDGNCLVELDCAGNCCVIGDEGCYWQETGPCGEEGPSNGMDSCGVCGGDNSSCSDCAGMPCSDAYVDNCGVCDDIPENDCVQDCAGTWGGNLELDECGVCGGDNACFGCTGSSSCNYDPDATIDDGSCIYPEDGYDCYGNCTGPDYDSDGICDDEDLDDDNNGCLDVDEPCCGDSDGDTCYDCSFGPEDPSNDGWDYDGDGLCDAGDADDDNDGAADDVDSNDNNEYVCSDIDGDTCDDCSSGTFDPANDGPDMNGNGICDAGDNNDTDGDGILDDDDSDPFNPYQCADNDGDACDDCGSGYYDPSNDGEDYDADGLCNLGDTDDDNDGVIDSEDCAPLYEWASEFDCAGICGGDNSSYDGCCGLPPNDDCTDDCYIDSIGACCIEGDADECGICWGDGSSCQLSGDLNGDGMINVIDIVMTVDHILSNNYDAVGDVNEDGQLNVLDIVMLVDWVLYGMSEADSDGDGVLDVDDSDPDNPYQCSDLDGDTCDDCSTGTFNTSDDGYDYDGDGQCDDGDCDDDNDGCQECWDYCY